MIRIGRTTPRRGGEGSALQELTHLYIITYYWEVATPRIVQKKCKTAKTWPFFSDLYLTAVFYKKLCQKTLKVVNLNLTA